MTKSELLTLLQDFDDNTPIVIALKEDGCWVHAESVMQTEAVDVSRTGLVEVALICGEE